MEDGPIIIKYINHNTGHLSLSQNEINTCTYILVAFPDHYSTHALSDPKRDCLSVACDHCHDKCCPSCDQLKSTMTEIEFSLRPSELKDEDRVNLMYTLQQAYQAIESWKAHQLKSIQQDKARTGLLENLKTPSVPITQDWAMEFVPQRYREMQADWFAKRGISWHFSVVARKIADKLQHQVFVHIVENSSQNSNVVVSIIRHTLQEFKNYNCLSPTRQRQVLPQLYHVSCLLTYERSDRYQS